MSAQLIPATQSLILKLVPHLRERDRYEIEGTHGTDFGAWALAVSRSEVAYACVTEIDQVQFIAGLARGRMGAASLWFAARDGWERYRKHLLRMWRIGRQTLVYRRIEALVYADNAVAVRFAERLGFKFEGLLRSYNLRGEDMAMYAITEAA